MLLEIVINTTEQCICQLQSSNRTDVYNDLAFMDHYDRFQISDLKRTDENLGRFLKTKTPQEKGTPANGQSVKVKVFE